MIFFCVDSLEFTGMDKGKCNAESSLQLQMLVGLRVKLLGGEMKQLQVHLVNVLVFSVRLFRGMFQAWIG